MASLSQENRCLFHKKILWIQVTIHQVCTFAALTVRKHRLKVKNPIVVAGSEWIFACNYEGTESLRIHVKEAGNPQVNGISCLFGHSYYLNSKDYSHVGM